MIIRQGILERIRTALTRAPIVVLTGPRRCGKTTIARQFLPEDSANYLDLEDPPSLARVVVIYPGSQRYALNDCVAAVPLAALAEPGQLFVEDPP